MLRLTYAVLLAAAAAAASLTFIQEPRPGEKTRLCYVAAQRVQDEARSLRNGVTAGADRAVLAGSQMRITNFIHDLERTEREWLATLGEDERSRHQLAIAALARERTELRQHASELAEALKASPVERRRVQEIARSIAQHAAAWERSVRSIEGERSARGR